ncbi:MAG: hypothetical protein GX303_00110 [Clostridiales bacterium]|nr:hypothetical protein [Clostridiales bacterium]
MNTDLYRHIYKNAEMGYDTIAKLLSKVTDDRFRAELTMQMEGYKRISDMAASRLKSINQPPKPISIAKKLPVRAGIAVNTLFDRSVSHIAEMMINGSSMGIVEITKKLNSVNLRDCEEEALNLGRDVAGFEQQNIERLKSYL